MPKPKANTADPSRNKRVTILVNAEELRRLDDLAQIQGLSRSDVLRRPLVPSAVPAEGIRRGD